MSILLSLRLNIEGVSFLPPLTESESWYTGNESKPYNVYQTLFFTFINLFIVLPLTYFYVLAVSPPQPTITTDPNSVCIEVSIISFIWLNQIFKLTDRSEPTERYVPATKTKLLNEVRTKYLSFLTDVTLVSRPSAVHLLLN